MRIPAFVGGLTMLAASALAAQGAPGGWQRRTAAVTPPPVIFRSTHSFHLPTVEGLSRGEFEVVIAHRFYPPVSEGNSTFLGLDGPANIRLSLAWAPSDRAMVTLGRTNWHDNLDLALKVKLFEGGAETMPFAVAVQGGGAWNMEMLLRNSGDHRNFQAWAQAIANVKVGGRLAVGVVPSYLYNPVPESNEGYHAIALGTNAEWYFSEAWGVIGEWTVSAAEPGYPSYAHDAASLGVHYETGGHFFKLLLTNSPFTNLTQHLAGTPYAFRSSDWRLGFNVTRRIGHGKRNSDR